MEILIIVIVSFLTWAYVESTEIKAVPKMENPPDPPKSRVLPPPSASPRVPLQYRNYSNCEYCDNVVLKNWNRCLSCGAPNKDFQKGYNIEWEASRPIIILSSNKYPFV